MLKNQSEPTDPAVDAVLSNYAQLSTSRRAAFKQLLKLGLSGPAAVFALGEQPAIAATGLADKSVLQDITKRLTSLVDNEEFSRDVATVASKANSAEKQTAAAEFIAKWSSYSTLKSKGFDPTGTKMSFRVFEVPKKAVDLLNGTGTLGAEEFVFVPNNQAKALQNLPAQVAPVDDKSTRLQLSSKPLAERGLPKAIADWALNADSPLRPDGWSVCLSSGPGGIICGSIGYAK